MVKPRNEIFQHFFRGNGDFLKMLSWWKAKKKRELEADFRHKSLRLRDGLFLHGELEVDIQEGRDLPDTDNFMFNIKRCFGQEKDVTDPYVTVCLDNTRIITTSVRKMGLKIAPSI